jgi:hypothetical protein
MLGGDAALAAGRGMTTVAQGAERLVDGAVGAQRDGVHGFLQGVESGGRDFDENGNVVTSTTGAKGRYQVLDSTNRDPGYGVRPAQNDSLEERARVGAEYYDALVKHYDGDQEKAMAAYSDGPGTLNRAVKDHGADWLNHMPAQAQKRVHDFRNWQQQGNRMEAGADQFAQGNGGGIAYNNQGPTNINVNITATVNGKEAKATAMATNGQTVTQAINVAGGSAQQRR